MKVYVLHYQYYDESEIKGVYSKEAMEAELARYAEYGRKRNDKAIKSQEQELEELKARRKNLGQEDRKLQERQAALTKDDRADQKAIKNERKKIMRQMNSLAVDIRNQTEGLKKMKNMTDEQLAEKEMNRECLSFEEFYVLGCED